MDDGTNSNSFVHVGRPADVTDISTRFRDGQKARVNAMAKGGVAYLDRARQAQEERDAKNELMRMLKSPLTTAIAAAYASLPPGEALTFIELVHSNVRLDRGVTG